VIPLFAASCYLLLKIIIERKDKYVPVLAVLLAAQVQTHYAMVFPLAGMVISILFMFWKERSLSDIKNSQKIYIIAGTLLFLLFLPSAYSFVKTGGESLTGVVKFHLQSDRHIFRYQEIPKFLFTWVSQPVQGNPGYLALCLGCLLFCLKRIDGRFSGAFRTFLPVAGMSIISLLLVSEELSGASYYLAYFSFFPPVMLAIAFRNIFSTGIPRFLLHALKFSLVCFILYACRGQFLQNYSHFQSSRWNDCPYEELVSISDILASESAGKGINIRTEGSNAPSSLPSIVRLASRRGVTFLESGRHYTIFTPPVAYPGLQKNILFEGKKFQLVRSER